LETAPHDPLFHRVDLPLTGSFFPLGFRVEIATNSRDVLEAAAASWGGYAPEYPYPPVELRVMVQPSGDLAPEPVFRNQRRLFSIVADRDNFACYESGSLFGYCFVSQKTAANHAWFRYFFLETMAYMLLAQRWVMPLHAACVARGETGVLLCGLSGAGKSTLAWACARAGWTYVTDDGTWLLTDRRPHRARPLPLHPFPRRCAAPLPRTPGIHFARAPQWKNLHRGSSRRFSARPHCAALPRGFGDSSRPPGRRPNQRATGSRGGSHRAPAWRYAVVRR
jgi:hypothetical protein